MKKSEIMACRFIAVTQTAKKDKNLGMVYYCVLYDPILISRSRLAEINFDIFFQENTRFDLFCTPKTIDKLNALIKLIDVVKVDEYCTLLLFIYQKSIISIFS